MHTNNSESKKPSWNIVIGRKTSLSPKLLESISDIDVLEDACTTYAIAMKKALAVIDEKIKHFYSSVSTSYDKSERSKLIKSQRKLRRLYNQIKIGNEVRSDLYKDVDLGNSVLAVNMARLKVVDVFREQLNQQHNDIVQMLCENNRVLCGISRASTKFARELLAHQGSSKKDIKIYKTSTRYFLRCCFKPSPFSTLGLIVGFGDKKIVDRTWSVEPAILTWLRRELFLANKVSLPTQENPILKNAIEGYDARIVTSYLTTAQGFLSRSDEVFAVKDSFTSQKDSKSEDISNDLNEVELGLNTVIPVPIMELENQLKANKDGTGAAIVDRVCSTAASLSSYSDNPYEIIRKTDDVSDAIKSAAMWMERPVPPWASRPEKLIHETVLNSGEEDYPDINSAMNELNYELGKRICCSPRYLQLVQNFLDLYGSQKQVGLLDFCAEIIFRSDEKRFYHGRLHPVESDVYPRIGGSVPSPVSSVLLQEIGGGNVVINSMTPYWLNARERWLAIDGVKNDISLDIKDNLSFSFHETDIYKFSFGSDWNGLQQIYSRDNSMVAGLPVDMPRGGSKLQDFRIQVRDGQFEIIDNKGDICGLVYAGGISPWALSGMERVLCEISNPWRFTFGERFRATQKTDYGTFSQRIVGKNVVYGRSAWVFNSDKFPQPAMSMTGKDYLDIKSWWKYHDLPDEVFISVIDPYGFRKKPVYSHVSIPASVHAALSGIPQDCAIEVVESLPFGIGSQPRIEYMASLRHKGVG